MGIGNSAAACPEVFVSNADSMAAFDPFWTREGSALERIKHREWLDDATHLAVTDLEYDGLSRRGGEAHRVRRSFAPLVNNETQRRAENVLGL
jgi:hypothetical protein